VSRRGHRWDNRHASRLSSGHRYGFDCCAAGSSICQTYQLVDLTDGHTGRLESILLTPTLKFHLPAAAIGGRRTVRSRPWQLDRVLPVFRCLYAAEIFVKAPGSRVAKSVTKAVSSRPDHFLGATLCCLQCELPGVLILSVWIAGWRDRRCRPGIQLGFNPGTMPDTYSCKTRSWHLLQL